MPLSVMLQSKHEYVNNFNIPEGPAPKVPVWIYFIQDDAGASSYSQQTALNAVLGINPYFSGLFSFSICGSTAIQSSTFNSLNLNEFVPLCDYVNALPETADDKCIKIFFVNDVFAVIGSGERNIELVKPVPFGVEVSPA
jgi:hypothetical protein